MGHRPCVPTFCDALLGGAFAAWGVSVVGRGLRHWWRHRDSGVEIIPWAEAHGINALPSLQQPRSG